jgi:CheY-like chemotaxis protein
VPTILIVDDMPENTLLLAEVVREECDATLIAEDGEEGLRLAREQRPDLILLDVVMPGMDGYEVCTALKADPVLRDIPVIFITSLDALDQETRGLDLGAVDYIIKPFNPAITRLRVRNQLLLKVGRDLLAERTRELEAALAEVKQLSGLLPICAWCKKVRDDQGYWKQIEVYIRDHSHAEFTHGVCPECMKGLMEE